MNKSMSARAQTLFDRFPLFLVVLLRPFEAHRLRVGIRHRIRLAWPRPPAAERTRRIHVDR